MLGLSSSTKQYKKAMGGVSANMRQCPVIWEYLEVSHMTQKEFAMKTGIGYSTLNKLLNGRTEGTSMSNKYRIASELGMDLVDIFGERKKRMRANYGLVSPYKNLVRFMYNNFASIKDFAEAVGVTPGYMCDLLKGGSQPTKYTIDSILRVTGMTYEECFKEGK